MNEYLQLVLIACIGSMQLAQGGPATLPGGHGVFCGAETFKYIAADKPHKNVIFSPLSIGSCLGLAYLGAEGETADELRTGLGFSGVDKSQIGEQFAALINNKIGSDTADAPTLKIVNRVYVNEGLEISPEFNSDAEKYFGAKAETIKFADSKNAVQNINSWVEDNTNHKIKNLLQSDAVDAETSSILVNAIYFKAKWATPFSAGLTKEHEFFVTADEKVTVNMMNNDDKYRYVDLPEIDATAMELPYKDSELSMIIVLPNKVDGLQELEKQCDGSKLNEIASRLQPESVDVSIPKFKIEFDIDLKEPLSNLGIRKMFSDEAQFGKLFTSKKSQKVDKVQHKAYIDVNEAGSEAAAATFLKIVPLSLNLKQKYFKADHPFAFAIRDNRAVYFAGHVARF